MRQRLAMPTLALVLPTLAFAQATPDAQASARAP